MTSDSRNATRQLPWAGRLATYGSHPLKGRARARAGPPTRARHPIMELLKLAALDAEDLAVISAHLQDAILKASDLAYLGAQHRFVLVARRFDWSAADDAPPRRRLDRHAFRPGAARAQPRDHAGPTRTRPSSSSPSPSSRPRRPPAPPPWSLPAARRSSSTSNASRPSSRISGRSGKWKGGPTTRPWPPDAPRSRERPEGKRRWSVSIPATQTSPPPSRACSASSARSRRMSTRPCAASSPAWSRAATRHWSTTPAASTGSARISPSTPCG